MVTVAVGRMISLSMNRAGTIPVIDMSYFTPFVYIFGVLEVNLAIIAASVPTFWPVIAKIAANKIFVVNEIEIHVERASRDSFGSGSAIRLSEGKDPYEERARKLSVATKLQDCSRLKQSNTSWTGKDLGSRPSQESQRHLYRAGSNEHRSSRSLTRNEGEDWLTGVNKMNKGKTTTTVERTDIPLEQIKAFDRR